MSRRARVVLALVLGIGGVLWLAARWLASERIVAPRPTETADLPPLSELEPSALTVPIRIHLEPLVQEVDDAVPRRWGSLERRLQVSDDDRMSLAFALERTPFRASFQGSIVRLAATVAYRARGWYDPPVLPEVSASCGTGEDEAPPRLVASLQGPLSLTRDWRLSTRTAVAQVAPASNADRDRCTITFLGFDMTDRVMGAARGFLERHTNAIDSLVAKADIRSSFQEWWGVLRDPIRLDDATWLLLRPESLRRGEIHGEGDVVRVTASLLARPRVILGHRPLPTLTPLPPLETGPVEGGLDILVEGTAQYRAMGERVTRELAGIALAAAGREMTITALQASGIGGGRLALEVEVEGDVNGRLFLVGTPAFDTSTGYTSVPDLEFAVETANLLTAGASWIADADVEELLRERARWRAAPAVEWIAEKLRQGLNRELTEGVRLEGTVQEVRILGVTAMKRGLVVRAAATADATLMIEAKGG